jgi:cytochrome c556
VWEKPDDFAAHAKKLEELATKLTETARGGDAKTTLAAFATMGKEGCGGCHTTYRKKDT